MKRRTLVFTAAAVLIAGVISCLRPGGQTSTPSGTSSRAMAAAEASAPKLLAEADLSKAAEGRRIAAPSRTFQFREAAQAAATMPPQEGLSPASPAFISRRESPAPGVKVFTGKPQEISPALSSETP